MPTTVPPSRIRKENFDRAIEEYDAKALTKSVDFDQHRFVTVERDGYTENRYVKGHKTLRGACDYLARVQEESEPFVPEHVLDLDSGEMHTLDVLAFVAPRSLDAVAVMMPRKMMWELREILTGNRPLVPSWGQQAAKYVTQALERRH